MKKNIRMGLWLLSGFLLSTGLRVAPVQGTTFGQQDVDQSKFIAIASPWGEGNYQLLILEQVSSQRLCWQEQPGQPGQPTLVNPLLLQFDFTQICSRKTDSNGYSPRMAGQDYALDYSLRIVKQGGDLVLIGFPTRDRNAPALEIGRTYGEVPGAFTKIILNPQWRLTRRTYNNKSLGHLYLTSDLPLSDIAHLLPFESTPSPLSPTPKPSATVAVPPLHQPTPATPATSTPIAPQPTHTTVPVVTVPVVVEPVEIHSFPFRSTAITSPTVPPKTGTTVINPPPPASLNPPTPSFPSEEIPSAEALGDDLSVQILYEPVVTPQESAKPENPNLQEGTAPESPSPSPDPGSFVVPVRIK